MLVVSRRPDDTIVFPTLAVTVRILRVAGSTVRVGVEAPPSVQVLRGELATEAAVGRAPPGETAHAARGRLNSATVALYLAQRQLQAGLTTEADGTLASALDQLGKLEAELTAANRPAAPPRRRIKALVVEDNPHECALLESYLRLSGLDVARAGDGQEALDYLATHEPPDAVLLDMRMPRLDGPTTVAAIRRDPARAGLKIFAVTGSPRAEFEQPSGPIGVDGWFTKPLNPAQLVETVAGIALGN